MDIKRYVLNKFKIFENIGYKKSVYTRNCDVEIYYSKNNSIIEINYSLSIPDNYIITKETTIKEISSKMFFALFVNISQNGRRRNIFDCEIFDMKELDDLRKEVQCLNMDIDIEVYKALDLYRDFLYRHIDVLR